MDFYMHPETARALLRMSINNRQVILLQRAIAAQADAAFDRGL